MERGNISEAKCQKKAQVGQKKFYAEGEFLALSFQLGETETQIDGERSDAKSGKRAKKGKVVRDTGQQKALRCENASQQEQAPKRARGLRRDRREISIPSRHEIYGQWRASFLLPLRSSCMGDRQ